MYTIFHKTNSRGGEIKQSKRYHVRFRDHLGRRQTIVAFSSERPSRALGEKIDRLVETRRSGIQLEADMTRWLEGLDDRLRARLVEMELIDALSVQADSPIAWHLEGRRDDRGELLEPGYKQALEAKGDTAGHVEPVIGRIRRVFEACAIGTWRDLIKPGAATTIQVHLGELRRRGAISGTTLNYYVRDIKGFCRWLKKTDRASSVALEALAGVDNAAIDSAVRRALTVEEMRELLPAVDASATTKSGITGPERALVYRFAFETGIRPGQMRALTVADFQLEQDPPTVTSHARHVKRRREHTQILRPSLAAALRGHFATKLPTAQAFKLPSSDHLADMLRRDLAHARAEWIRAAATPAEQIDRAKSDFLAEKNRAGEIAVFYSARHGHGTALADAGASREDIAASMHHASTKTTARYIHEGRKSATRAIGAMPDLSYSRDVATGTDGRPIDQRRNLGAAAGPGTNPGARPAETSIGDGEQKTLFDL